MTVALGASPFGKISVTFFFPGVFEDVSLNPRTRVFQSCAFSPLLLLLLLFLFFFPSTSHSLSLTFVLLSPCHAFQQQAGFLVLQPDLKSTESNFTLSLGDMWIRPLMLFPSLGCAVVTVCVVTDDALLCLMEQDNKLYHLHEKNGAEVSLSLE